MTLTPADLLGGLETTAEALQRHEQALNEADSRLGDGDTGMTLRRLTQAMLAPVRADLPDDIGAFFKKTGMAGASATGSSLGTLLAVSFLALAKHLAGRTTLEPADIPGVLEHVLSVMQSRGGAKPGDKTVLDSVAAIAKALSQPGTANPATTAAHAALQALDEFRGRVNRIGRARMFGERTIGADDPGMLAVAFVTAALAGGLE